MIPCFSVLLVGGTVGRVADLPNYCWAFRLYTSSLAEEQHEGEPLKWNNVRITCFVRRSKIKSPCVSRGDRILLRGRLWNTPRMDQYGNPELELSCEVLWFHKKG